MRHHFQDHRYGFGVSSPIWDVVFRTMPRIRAPLSRGSPAEPPRARTGHRGRRAGRRAARAGGRPGSAPSAGGRAAPPPSPPSCRVADVGERRLPHPPARLRVRPSSGARRRAAIRAAIPALPRGAGVARWSSATQQPARRQRAGSWRAAPPGRATRRPASRASSPAGPERQRLRRAARSSRRGARARRGRESSRQPTFRRARAPTHPAGSRRARRREVVLGAGERGDAARQRPARRLGHGAAVAVGRRRLAISSVDQLAAAAAAHVLDLGLRLGVALDRVGRELVDVGEDRLGEQAQAIRNRHRRRRRRSTYCSPHRRRGRSTPTSRVAAACPPRRRHRRSTLCRCRRRTSSTTARHRYRSGETTPPWIWGRLWRAPHRPCQPRFRSPARYPGLRPGTTFPSEARPTALGSGYAVVIAASRSR